MAPSSPSSARSGKTSIARNPRARHDYHILDTYDAGLVLTGSEVKSLREGKASLVGAFAHVRGAEVWLEGLNISTYDKAGYSNHQPLRSRKVLLHKREIRRLIGAVTRQGQTLVPLELYFSGRGLAKLTLALARGKQLHDKREDLKRRAQEREVARAFRGRGRGGGGEPKT